jgi:hypothetical protein
LMRKYYFFSSVSSKKLKDSPILIGSLFNKFFGMLKII